MTDINSAATASRGSWGERLKLRIGTVVWFVLLLGLLLALPVLFEIHWLVVVGLVVLALILALPITWLVRKLFAGQRRLRPLTSYVKSAVAIFGVLGIALAAPIFALALVPALRPLVVPQAILSNGPKTVVFQGMIHIGSEGFYKSVVYDLEKALADGYVIFYEGVQGDPEGDKWLSETVAGGGNLNDNYVQFGNACGLHFQLDYFALLDADKKVHPERHIAADVNTGDMMREYQRLVATDPAFAAAVKDAKPAAPAAGSGSGGGLGNLFNMVAQASPGQQSLVGTACRGFLSWLLGQKEVPSALNPVIVDFRNLKLAERIETGPDKIYMTYGAGHLPGLLKLLKADDPAWEIKSLKWLRAIETPETLEGQLN